MVCCQYSGFISSIRLIDPFPTDKFGCIRMSSKQNRSACGEAMLAKHLFSCHISGHTLSAAAVEDIQNVPVRGPIYVQVRERSLEG